jgi:hypothetical protein
MLLFKGVAGLSDALKRVSFLLELFQLGFEPFLDFFPAFSFGFELRFEDLDHSLLLLQCLRYKGIQLYIHRSPLFH